MSPIVAANRWQTNAVLDPPRVRVAEQAHTGWVKVSHRSVFVHIEGEGGLTMCGLHVWDSCDGLPADDAQVCDRCVRAVEPPEPVLDTTSEPVVQTWT